MQQQQVSVSEAQLQTYIDSSPEIREMDALLATKRTMLERVESMATLGKNDPSYQRLVEEIADFEESRGKLRHTLRPRLLEELKSHAETKRQDELAHCAASQAPSGSWSRCSATATSSN